MSIRYDKLTRFEKSEYLSFDFTTTWPFPDDHCELREKRAWFFLWKCRDELGMEGYMKPWGQPNISTPGYGPMATRPPRHIGIPRRCLFRTRMASRVKLPDNRYTDALSPSHRREGAGKGLWENEQAWAGMSVPAAFFGYHGDPVGIRDSCR